MIELALNKLQKYYGATMVLKDITFDVQTAEKVGVVGGNGCGKSTLLKIIMGLEGYEQGMLSVKKGSSIGYLEQMPLYEDSIRVIDVLNLAFERIDKVYEEMKELEEKLCCQSGRELDRTLERYAKVQALYESIGGYDKEEKLSKVCTGLKISEDFKERYFNKLSGGEKTTVILGKILLQSPDILLLDEPSNHLDLEAMEWLEQYLKEYRGIVLIVSHDRYFLDNVVTKIIEIENMVSTTYPGNYTAYVKERDRQLQIQLEAYLEQQKKIKTMEKAIAQLRDWAIRADNNKFFRRAASMQLRLDKIDRLDKPVTEKDGIKINVNLAERSGNNVVIVENLKKSFGKKVLFDEAELLIRNRERVVLIGANGSGKSTLVKILLGEINCDAGRAVLGSSIKLGYLPQNIQFNDEKSSVLECFREDISITEGKAREYLARYMFFGEAVFKKVGSLSGGERSRLVLSKLMYKEVNLLILDEPTNHLDIDAREELEELLKDFEGTVLFVSHDRYFINNIAGRVVELIGGKLITYQGNYEYYKEKKQESNLRSEFKIKNNLPLVKSEEKKFKADEKKEKKNKEKRNIEIELESLEQEIKDVDKAIEEASENYEKLNELYKYKLSVNSKIEELMSVYFEIEM